MVQAVACALQIQGEFGQRSPDALQHRVGIHLGDVFREGGDVAGDGVNIAARLQTKAEPGAICLSASVYDAVKGKVPMQARSLGPQSFKNIAEPIVVYLARPADAAPPLARRKRSALWPAGAAVVMAALAVVFWRRNAPPAAAPQHTPPASAPAATIPDRSIAVLPFTNMSQEKDNAFFADGVHEDLLTNLANLGGLRVISRTSVIAYRDTKKSVREIGRELGVAYLLEGSVRRSGGKVRVTGQLINVATDEHVWAKNYDRDLTDVFAIQSDLAQEIAGAMRALLTPREKSQLEARPTSDLEDYDLFLRASQLQTRLPLRLQLE